MVRFWGIKDFFYMIVRFLCFFCEEENFLIKKEGKMIGDRLCLFLFVFYKRGLMIVFYFGIILVFSNSILILIWFIFSLVFGGNFCFSFLYCVYFKRG